MSYLKHVRLTMLTLHHHGFKEAKFSHGPIYAHRLKKNKSKLERVSSP